MKAYIDVGEKVNDKYDAMEFDERKKISEQVLGDQIRTIEKVKDMLTKNYDRQMRELVEWQKSLAASWERSFGIGCTKEDFGSSWTPKLYGVYYYPDFEQPESVCRSQWTDTWTDNRRKNTVGIYKTKQQALDKAIKLGWLEEELK